MPVSKTKRVERSYSPTVPMTRAALDFVSEWGKYLHFGQAFDALTEEQQHQRAVEMFEDRQVVTATFSIVLPEIEVCMQPFIITFSPKADGISPVARVEVERVAELRAQAKLYPRDASAYSGIRKPKRKARALDETL